MKGTRVTGSKGSARAYEELFPGSRAESVGAKRGAVGAPNVRDKGGVPEGGACPPLQGAKRRKELDSNLTMS